MQKILFVIDSLGGGGAEKSTELLAVFLMQRGWDVNIAVLKKSEVGVEEQVRNQGVVVLHIAGDDFYRRRKNLSKIIKQKKPQIVHSILFLSNLIVRSIRPGKQFIHIESLVSTTYAEERKKDRRVNQKALRIFKLIDRFSAGFGVDGFHAISETVKKHYCKELGINAKKIQVIYRGRKPFGTKKIASYAAGDVLKVLNIGRHVYAKGQIFLLQAMKRIVESGYPVKCVILGKEGEETNALKTFLVKNNLQDYVELAGYHLDVETFLLDAHVFVFPSLYEGLGGGLIEAQSAGLALCCNDIEVLREVSPADDKVVFFNVRNPDTIAESILFFFNNPEKIAEYGEASLNNFYKRFDESINHQKMEDYYKSFMRSG